MSYGTAAMVKERLLQDSGDSTHDTEIANGLTYGDGYIDAAFAAVNQAVPVVVPQPIKDASADLAAFYFFRNRNPTKATTFLDSAKMLLETHLQSYRKGVMFRKGSEHFE